MTLKELYNLKLYEYKEFGLKEKPEKLLAMLLLPEKDTFEPLKVSEGEFYNKYKNRIDENIAKVEKDFNFTKEEFIEIIEETIECDDYEDQKVWYAFGEGFGAVHWGILYYNDNTPEELFTKYFDDNQLNRYYDIEQKAIANNINIKKLDDLISKIIDKPSSFYSKIDELLSVEERIFIMKHLKGKNCLNCTNSSCRVETKEKIGFSEGSECLGWINPEIIGKSKVLRISDINKLK